MSQLEIRGNGLFILIKQRATFVTALTIISLLLSACGATLKIGVPDTYHGKLVKLKIKQVSALEVLEIDGEVVENPSTVLIYPGKYTIKSKCKAEKGIFTTTKSYSFKFGYKFELDAVEDEVSGTCRARLMQFKSFVM